MQPENKTAGGVAAPSTAVSGGMSELHNTAPKHNSATVLLEIEYGPHSINFDPNRRLAIFATTASFLMQADSLDKDYQKAIVPFGQLDAVRGGVAGRGHVLIFHDGDDLWRKATEKMIADVGGSVASHPGSIVIVRGDLIEPKAVDWLWDGWLAAGKLHILAGAPGTGKTTLALALAAILTQGSAWPDGTASQAADVLMWSGEDDTQDTLVPRLTVMGADMRRFHFVDGMQDQDGKRPFDPAHDIAALVNGTGSIKPKLLILDPIVSAVAGDSHKNTETRRALQPMVDLAFANGIAVLGISHFTKGSVGRDPVERVTGSLAFGALPRVVMATAKASQQSGGQRIFCRAKSNIGADAGGFKYDIEQVPLIPGLQASRVVWGDPLDQSARELLADAEATHSDQGGALGAAMEFLETELGAGPKSAREIFAAADQAGLSEATIRRACKELGIKPFKEGMRGGWQWAMPAKVINPTEDAQPKVVSIFGEREHLQAPQSDLPDDFVSAEKLNGAT